MTTATHTSTSVEPPSGAAADPAPAPAMTISTGLRALLPFARDSRGRYLLSAALAAAGTLCQLGPYFVVYRAVQSVVAGDATRDRLYRLAVLALALVLAQYVLLGVSTWLSHRAAFATLLRLRLQVGRRLGRVPLGFVTSRRSGEVQRTLANDIERLELFLAHAVPDLASAVVSVLVLTAWMFVVDWRLATAVLVSVLAAFALASLAVRRGGQDKLADYVAAMGRMNGSVVELVRGLPVVRTFNRSGETFTETRESILSAARYQAQWGREFLPLYTGFQVLAAATVVVIVPVGLLFWQDGTLSAADLLFFFLVGLGYGAPVVKLTELGSSLSHLTLGARLVTELRDAGELPEAGERVPLAGSTVEFRHVSFSYPGTEPSQAREALREVSFTASPGTVVALVGPSGAGKSTVARLVCRFYDVDAGAVLVGGADVRDMPFSQLMEQVAFVFQDTFLFDDTVAANLRLARADATDDELVAATTAARVHDVISRLPQGYDTPLGERGGRLSGGERQRLAIARALLKDTPIVVLDEATAFVDPENEAALQDAISALTQDKTVLIVAHRLSTVAGADQILVLDGGRVVERGRHGELVAAGELYARLWDAFQGASALSLPAAVHGGTTR